jgi:hypothetical protein
MRVPVAIMTFFIKLGDGHFNKWLTPFRFTLAMVLLWFDAWSFLDGISLSYAPWQSAVFGCGLLFSAYILFSNCYYDIYGDES